MKYLLLYCYFFPSVLFATSILYEKGNSHEFPFSYKPTDPIEIIVSYTDKKAVARYPDGLVQILNKEPIRYKGSNIIADFNFDGYNDIAIHSWMSPRGLNSGYDIFIWDEKDKKLFNGGYLVNPNIESGFIIEEFLVPHPQCEDETPMCVNRYRYQWNNGHFQQHSKIVDTSATHNRITFYKNDQQDKTIIVPKTDIEIETKKWEASRKNW